MQQKTNTPIMYAQDEKNSQFSTGMYLSYFGEKQVHKESRCPWHDKYLQLPLMSIEYHITDFPI